MLDRFFSPHYWVPPILLKEKHHSRFIAVCSTSSCGHELHSSLRTSDQAVLCGASMLPRRRSPEEQTLRIIFFGLERLRLRTEKHSGADSDEAGDDYGFELASNVPRKFNRGTVLIAGSLTLHASEFLGSAVRLASWKEEFPVVGPLFAVLALADPGPDVVEPVPS